MNRRFFHLAAVVLFSAAPLQAGEPAPAKADAVPPYELKRRSVFPPVEADARAPFWPIGWVKRKTRVVEAGPAPAAVRVQLDEKNFKVTSILLGAGTAPSLAVINGRAYSEGEYLRVPKGSAVPPARIRVRRINDGTVILENADQILVASLHRPELSTRRGEELLLDPDR